MLPVLARKKMVTQRLDCNVHNPTCMMQIAGSHEAADRCEACVVFSATHQPCTSVRSSTCTCSASHDPEWQLCALAGLSARLRRKNSFQGPGGIRSHTHLNTEALDVNAVSLIIVIIGLFQIT